MWMAAAAVSCSSVATLYNRQPMASTFLYEQQSNKAVKKKKESFCTILNWSFFNNISVVLHYQ